MNLLPNTSCEFSSKEYWNSFFKKRGNKSFEWYGEYPELCGFIHKYIKPKDSILVVGCGNSALSSMLYDVGYGSITNIDISHVVIKQMEECHGKSRPGLLYKQMDALEMSFRDEAFSVVVDKGTLDALMPDDVETTRQTVTRLFNEIDRVLRFGGRYFCVSLLQDHILKHLVHYFSACGWMIRVCRCLEAEQKSAEESDGHSLPVFITVCTKFKKTATTKPVFEVSMAGNAESVERVDSAAKLMESVKSTQDAALICSGLRCSTISAGEVVLDVMCPQGTTPRYKITVSELEKLVNKPVNTMTFAAFIVPQGRESEWLFGSAEGRRALLTSSGYDRLAVISLNRGHTYESIQAIQDELAASIIRLAPPSQNQKIPFLTVGGEVGTRTEILRGESDISGSYIIEEVEDSEKQVYRRLIFLATQNIIQSEARLKTVKSRRGKLKTVVDTSYLSCEHHIYMTMGLALVAPTWGAFSVLVVGLGGGGLCSYMHQCFSQASITAVDIDPAMLKVATEYFGLKLDDRMKVHIGDGIEFLKQHAANGIQYDAVLFDVDSKDTSVGMSCPPQSFLQPTLLQAVSSIIQQHGVFVLNCVCRSVSLRTDLWAQLKTIFLNVSSINLEADVNEVIFCQNRPTCQQECSLRQAAERVNGIVKLKNLQSDNIVNISKLNEMLRTS